MYHGSAGGTPNQPRQAPVAGPALLATGLNTLDSLCPGGAIQCGDECGALFPAARPAVAALWRGKVSRFINFGGGWNMKFGGARYFQRREDYQPPQTPRDSPFRQF